MITPVREALPNDSCFRIAHPELRANRPLSALEPEGEEVADDAGDVKQPDRDPPHILNFAAERNENSVLDLFAASRSRNGWFPDANGTW